MHWVSEAHGWDPLTNKPSQIKCPGECELGPEIKVEFTKKEKQAGHWGGGGHGAGGPCFSSPASLPVILFTSFQF